MRIFVLFFLAFPLLLPASNTLRDDLKAKRAALASFHQEFEVTQTFKARTTQSSTRRVTLDAAATQWREASSSGSGTYIRVFDGKDLLRTEEGLDEFVRVKRKAKDDDPQPGPYGVAANLDWSKAVVEERRDCGLSSVKHECAVIRIPQKPRVVTSTPQGMTKLAEGNIWVVADTQTGLFLAARSLQSYESTLRSNYMSETIYTAKRLSYGEPTKVAFQMPEGCKEVKELTEWNASRIRKQLAGKPAPEMNVTDIQGKPVTLAALKGKTVLLDFWTTWCPPCRADAPALDKLYQKFGAKDLAIVGVSVSEERAIVEKFLKEHPHEFPTVLTSENEMPRPYQIGVFPTYMVINADGTLAAAVEGDQGFSELKKLLKKAGLDVD